MLRKTRILPLLISPAFCFAKRGAVGAEYINKKEQLLIAEFILGMDAYIKSKKSGGGEPQEEPPVAVQGEETEPETSAGEENAEPSRAAMTNAEYFRANKTGAQVAFKTFARRLASDPDRYGVFDEGRILKAASFAYWLNMPKD